MSSKPSLRNALIALVVWVVITIGGGLLQAGGPSSLDGLVSGGIVWAIPLAALFLLVTYRGKWDQLGLSTSGSWREARPVVIAVALLLVLAVANGLPASSVLIFLVLTVASGGLSLSDHLCGWPWRVGLEISGGSGRPITTVSWRPMNWCR